MGTRSLHSPPVLIAPLAGILIILGAAGANVSSGAIFDPIEGLILAVFHSINGGPNSFILPCALLDISNKSVSFAFWMLVPAKGFTGE